MFCVLFFAFQRSKWILPQALFNPKNVKKYLSGEMETVHVREFDIVNS